MSQFALPLAASGRGPARIVIGNANRDVAEALVATENWPFRTAVLTGPPRSGKSLLARWFVNNAPAGTRRDAIDDAQHMPEDEVFHRWNRAQESGTDLLIVGVEPPWNITLPDLRSRLGGSLQLDIGQPDDDMARDLLLSLAQERGLPLRDDAADYLVPRASRSQVELEKLVATIDRLSLERKAPPNMGIWRAALEAVHGPEEPRLI
ncbi:HdaA/DnaA family protein [Aurantiacibacter rhizosphaerae]|uniref:ATPase n=1 Tax=Aurantiacibacter rhizosphaerae TaxID=2691582 RepID=A0A844XD20_9SPHN|nr:DnaA/Hda family protein [Aurantiacibacter rhizosphaerae]MWV27659.1 ATPase [Aurantiacibacter rhizosphaerae]